jgi:tRNA1Val (adenine37-N6)-methyltransferase
MKVGTDGVLLGAWVDVTAAENILDIGTGSGVIALMMAQRSSDRALIDAVEIEEADAEEAQKNVMNSPWPLKVTIIRSAIQNFHSEKEYDLVVSNPPFFFNSYAPPDKRRLRIRHTALLSHEELISAAVRLISPSGSFNIILPPVEGKKFIEVASQNGLFCSRKWLFKTRIEKKEERWLMEFKKSKKVPEEGEIVLYQAGEEWSEAYRQLMKDFYLKA